MSKETGGNAFPGHTNPRPGHLANAPQGMTLRDYFAATALQGMLAYAGDEVRGNYHTNSTPTDTAELAYRYADAMLEARQS